jgi:large subunit ribosomal protein L15
MSMLHEILAQSPRYKRPLRKGRGESSGHGKTSGKGTKGAGARVGGPYWKPGHEGGQTPIHRRLPTRGFSNDRWARDWHIVNLADIEAQFEAGAIVDAAALIEKGLVPDVKLPVKVLGDGVLTRKLTFQVGWYSKSAVEKIVAAGGSALTAKGEPFEFPKPKKKFVKREKEPAKKAKGESKGEPKAEPKPEAAAEAKPADAKPAEAK